MYFILFLNTMISSIFGIRILQFVCKHHTNLKLSLTKIGTLYVSYLLSIALLWRGSPVIYLFNVYVPFMLMSAFTFINQMYFEKALNDYLVSVLHHTVLQMKCGNSLRASLKSSCGHIQNAKIRQIFVDVYENVVFSQQVSMQKLPRGLWVFTNELRELAGQTHKVVNKAEILLFKYQLISDFRRRSGQITSQIRVQAYILSGLYIALLGFVIWSAGFNQTAAWLFPSVFLFCLGIILSIYLGEKREWKI